MNKENINMAKQETQVIFGQGLVIKPGDKVLLTLDDQETDPVTIRAIKETMNERFPENEFFIIAGVTASVVRDEPTEQGCTCGTGDVGHWGGCPALTGEGPWEMQSVGGKPKFYPAG